MLNIGNDLMEEKKIKVNNREYNVTLNDQTQLNAMNLKGYISKAIPIWTVLMRSVLKYQAPLITS